MVLPLPEALRRRAPRPFYMYAPAPVCRCSSSFAATASLPTAAT